jgi:hypothetical protein
MSNYNIWVEKIDGTKITHPSDKIYSNQLDNWVEGYLSTYPEAMVLVTVWKHNQGEVRKKFYSPACWNMPTLAIEMFEDMCKNMDWYYEYSDDHRVWKDGAAAYDALKRRYAFLSKGEFGGSADAIWKMYNPFIKEKENA